MGTKHRFANNRFSLKTYRYIVIVSALLASIIYCRYLATFSLYGAGQYIGFAACLLVIGGLAYFTSLFGQRNLISIVTVVLLPILFYDSVQMWKYSDLIMWVEIGAAAISCLAAFFYSKRRVRSIQKASLKKKAGIGISAKVVRLVCCVVLLAMVISSKVWIRNRQAVLIREIQFTFCSEDEEIPDYENSLSYNIASVSKLDPAGGWCDLSLEEKADILEVIIRIECRYYGMTTVPKLKISYLGENTLGEYDYTNDEINVSYQYIVSCDKNGFGVLQVVLHEMRHRYQAKMVELLMAVRDDEELSQYASLQLFSEAAEYEEELADYKTAEDGSLYSYYIYASQKLELDAERYANSALTGDYYPAIQKYLAADSAE